jgi:hypothetical protein
VLNVARSIRVLVLGALALLEAVAAQAANLFYDTVSGINLGNVSGRANLSGKHVRFSIAPRYFPTTGSTCTVSDEAVSPAR